MSEYYVPTTTANSKPLIDGVQTMRVRLKEETVAKYLSQTIYSSWKSAIRELYANELTAAKKAARMGASPTIEVTLDPRTRELVIWGKDSLGITAEKFKVLRYYGRSGNFSGQDAGQFGFGMKCVSEDTECLTHNGWKKYSHLNIGDLIATYNMEKRVCEFKPLKNVYVYKRVGSMYRIGWRHGPLVTENHRNVVSRVRLTRQGGIGRRGWFGKHEDGQGRKTFTPSDLIPRQRVRYEDVVATTKLSSNDRILLHAPFECTPNAGLGSEDLAALIGWVITEGHYSKSKSLGKHYREVTQIGISQNENKYASEIRELLRRLLIPWREHHCRLKSGNVNTVFFIKGPLAKRIRELSPDKQLNEYLSNLPPNELQALFQTMLKGDGSLNHSNRGYKNFIFTQKSRSNVDWFQIIALKLGYYCGISPKRGNCRVSSVYVSNRKYIGLNSGHGTKKKVTAISYNGTVWCPETENGTWIARRDGWPFITGNSYCLLNKTMKVETYARETGERYGFTAEKGVEFRPTADEELTIEDYGTKVSLTIKPQLEDGQAEEKEIRLEEVVRTLEEVCRFGDVDTYLNIPSALKRKVKHSWGLGEYEETVLEAGRRKLNLTPEQYARKNFGDKGYDFDLDTEDFHFYGYLGRYEDDDEVNVASAGEVRLVGMPIPATISNPNAGNERDSPEKPSYPMSFWVVNLKDERRFAPTADRERLRDGVFDPVNEKIIQFLKREFEKMEIKSFADYRESPFKPILDAHADSRIRPYLTEETSRTCAALSTSVGGVADEGQQGEEGERRWGRRSYCAPAGTYETQLKGLVLKSRHLFMLRRKRKDRGFIVPVKTAVTLRKILRRKYPDAEVFLHPGFSYHSYNWNNDDNTAGVENSRRVLSEQYGMPDAVVEAENVRKELGRDWRRLAGVPQRRGKLLPDEVVVWARMSYRVEPLRRPRTDVGANTVRVRESVKGWADLLRAYHVEGFGFTKDGEGVGGGLTESEFADRVSSTMVVSAKGKTTIGKVASAGSGPVCVFTFDDPQILGYYRPKSSEIVVADTDESAFAAIAYLRLFGRQHTVLGSVGKEAVKPPFEPLHESDSREVNYLYIAQKRLGRSANKEELALLLRNAIGNSNTSEEMSSLVETAARYSQFLG